MNNGILPPAPNALVADPKRSRNGLWIGICVHEMTKIVRNRNYFTTYLREINLLTKDVKDK